MGRWLYRSRRDLYLIPQHHALHTRQPQYIESAWRSIEGNRNIGDNGPRL